MLRKWFAKHHGVGAPNQYDVYRCERCRGLVTHHMIAKGGCPCGSSRMSPTNPTWGETVKLMVTAT